MELISLTLSATDEFKRLINIRNKNLLISVKGGGCSGFVYDMQWVDEFENGVEVILHTQNGSVGVDPISVVYIAGMEVDYVQDDFKKEFKFNNPNANSECGCGKSFS